MAVHSILTKSDINHILEKYDVGKLLKFEGIKEGIENTNYLITTDINKYILTIFENRVKKNDLPFYFQLMQNTYDKNINCPTVLSRIDQHKTFDINKKKAAIFKFLKGKCLKTWTENNCYDVGKVLAKFHKGSYQAIKKKRNNFGVKCWEDLYNKCFKKIDFILPNSQYTILKEIKYLKNKWKTAKLPKGLIHADLFPDNVLFNNGKISGIIDFYFSCYDFLIYDLAILLNAWAFKNNKLNKQNFFSILKGYETHRKLSCQEKKMLNIFLRGASVRFLMTRVYDKLNVKKNSNVIIKDPNEYFIKLKFHQSIDSFDAYGK
tara:strand:- start:1071 stop:2030 length:960 start_codon:yes stop_codon:yes gene_type:complete